jgi:hypothetical protein
MPSRLQIRGPPVEPVRAAARAVGVGGQRKPGSLDGYPARAAHPPREAIEAGMTPKDLLQLV